MALLVVTTIVTAMGIAREREMGTMEQILVTPIQPAVLLLGKCLPFAGLGLIVVTAILVVGSWLFGVPLRGSLAVIYVGTSIYLLSALGIGIFISTVSRSQQQAILGGFFFVMPAILLRIRIEERVLSELPEYTQYCGRTKRLIPFVW